MKITQTNTKSHRKLFTVGIPTVIVILLIIAGATYLATTKSSIFNWYPFGKSTTSTINYGPATKDEIESGNQIKTNTVQNNTSDTTKPDNESDSGNTNTPTGTTSVTITSAQQLGTTLSVRAFISELSSTGTCTISVSKSGSATFTQDVGVQASTSFSVCKGFDIPVSDLASAGTWTVTITYNGNNLTGSATALVGITK